ncbi:DUF4145 domain-containing protein [Kitasatospora brasiliensis]|uniref:DUF4145 domain-containing protein n=1 Tax=Kitasatospora brasiliensis TaxID=3058040 RepID=UPI00292FE520|nr:DUF4145 domain-containing protein [Kitasatospora sp. K002]
MTSTLPAEIAFCPTCMRHHSMTVHGAVTEQPDFDHGRDEIRHVMLASCGGCGGVVTLVQDPLPDDTMDEPEVVWPTTSRPIPPEVPRQVAKSLAEARRCFELAGAHAATATMVRRAVELICRDHGHAKGTLAKKLTEMQSAGTIDGRLFGWADSLRFLGNDGAHGDNVSRQDAEDGLALGEALVEYVYVLAAKHKAYEQRRSTASSKRAPATTVPVQAADSTSAPVTQG